MVAEALNVSLRIPSVLLSPLAGAGDGSLLAAGSPLSSLPHSASQPQGFFWRCGNLLSPLRRVAQEGRFKTSRTLGVGG